MLYKVALAFESVDESLKCETEKKIVESWFVVVLCIMFYKLVLGNFCIWKRGNYMGKPKEDKHCGVSYTRKNQNG